MSGTVGQVWATQFFSKSKFHLEEFGLDSSQALKPNREGLYFTTRENFKMSQKRWIFNETAELGEL